MQEDSALGSVRGNTQGKHSEGLLQKDPTWEKTLSPLLHSQLEGTQTEACVVWCHTAK